MYYQKVTLCRGTSTPGHKDCDEDKGGYPHVKFDCFTSTRQHTFGDLKR